MTNPEIIDIRGVRFTNVTLDEADLLLRSRTEAGETTAVYTPNPEIVQMCIEDNSLYSVINSAELIIPDGIGVVKASAILGTPLKEKVAGIELGDRVLKMAAEKGYKVFLFGGRDASRCDSGVSIAEQCIPKFREKYHGIQVCGTRDGYCGKDGEDNEKTLEMINSSGAEILFVCLGAPLQEKWIYANRERLPGVKVYMALGGSLDVYSDNVKRAPSIFIKLGLEWFYRLLKEPYRIGRMMSLPRFYYGTKRLAKKQRRENNKKVGKN